jgi:hypothetical protein
MMVALWTNMSKALELFFVKHTITLGALAPQTFGNALFCAFANSGQYFL